MGTWFDKLEFVFCFFPLIKKYTLLFALLYPPVCKPESVDPGIAKRAKVEKNCRIHLIMGRNSEWHKWTFDHFELIYKDLMEGQQMWLLDKMSKSIVVVVSFDPLRCACSPQKIVKIFFAFSDHFPSFILFLHFIGREIKKEK